MKKLRTLLFSVLTFLAIGLTLFNFTSCEDYNDGDECDNCGSDYECNDGLDCLRFTADNGRSWFACGDPYGISVCPEH